MANLTRIKNNQITDSTITNVKIASGTLTGDLMNPQLTFNSNLILNGNLTVSGNFTAVQSTTTQITDPLITLGMGNPGISYDLGSVLIRGSGGNRFMGWKENAGAFVFINTTEDGTTTGNIPTTAYSNVIIGNLTTIGSSGFGDITLSGNTIIARGGLTLTSGSGTTTISNATVLNSTLSVSSTASIAGTATVNALISNSAVQGTTVSASANATVNALTVNNSATVGTTLSATGGIQNTIIGNATAAAGYFTTLNADTATVNALVSNGAIQSTTLNTSSNATVNALTVNNSATVGSTLSAASIQNTPIGTITPSTGNFTTLGSTGTGTFASVVSNGAIQGTAISGSGTGTFASVVSNGAIQGTSITGSGTGTFASVVSNGAIQGTAVSASANATVNALTVNNSATIGTSLGVAGNVTAGNISVDGTASINQITILGGIQNTPIGNATPSTGNFTTLGSTGTATFASVVSNGAIQGTAITGSGTGTFASLVSNGAIQGTTIGGSGNATVAALTVNGSATVGTTLSAAAGVQNTPIGNANPNTGNFTTLNATGAITGATTLTTTGTATVNALVSNGAIQGTGITGSGTGTFASVVSNGAIQGTAISGSGTGTFASVVSNGAIQGTAITSSGNATVAALTVNGSATVGTTLSATGGIQNTPIGNGTASSGAFTTLNATGAITGATTLTTTGTATVNALTVNSAAQVGTTLGVNGVATVNSLVSNTSITAVSGAITGNLVVGNLNVQGNLSYINSQTLIVQDPIVELNTGPNGAPLTSNPGFDSGVRPHYYDNADRSAFFGRTNDAGYFEYYSNVISETGNVITGTYGTIKTGNLLLNGLASVSTTLAVSGNTTVNALTVNNSATVGTTLSATGGIQNTVIGNATAAAGYFTTLQSSSNTTVNALTVNGAATVGSTLGVTGNVVAGNISVTNINASNGTFTNNVTVLGTLTATSNIVANTSGIFYGDATTGNNAIYAGVPDYTYLGSNIVMQVTGNVNNYSQINFQNVNDGPQASTDFVLTASNGTDSTYFFNMGIGSSTYNYADLYPSYKPNDGYLLINGGNLLINPQSPGKVVKFIVGGSADSDIVGKFTNTQFIVSTTTASTNSTNGALTVAGGAGIAGAINGGSTLNVTGTATVNALVSNGAIQGTAISGSGTGTFASVLSNGAIQGTAITGSGTATFASVVSNGAIQGTTISGSANATVNALTVNNSATIGTTLGVVGNITAGNINTAGTATVGQITILGGIQNTPIGNATPSTGNFTTLTSGTSFNTSGTATVNALVSNGAIQGTTIGGSGNATVAALTVNGSATVGTTLSATGGIQNTPIGNGTASSGAFTTLNATGAITGATTLVTTGAAQHSALTVNTGANIGTDLTVLGNLYVGTTANATAFTNPIFIGVDSGSGYVQAAIVNTFGNASADFTAYANNGTDVQGWMDMGMTGNVFNDSRYTITGYNDGYIFANGVTGNSSLGGNLVIATGSGGSTNDIVFATGGFLAANEKMRFSNSAGALQIKTSTAATGTTSGALQVSGGASVAGNLYVAGIGSLGNITYSNTTISSNLTNTGITINPNGTGSTVINDGLNSSKTIINGTSANTFVVSGTQVGVNTASFISGATFQVNATDSILLPVGTLGNRPGTPQTGMLRYSTSAGSIEWYDGATWNTPTELTTIAIANTQIGNGSATTFTLPVGNATTAGTIVSINGVVQQPISAYAVSGGTVEFTEAPSSTDIIDFRIFTTTAQVTSVVDTAGTTGLFLEPTAVNDKIILFKTNGSESLSIQANAEVQVSGNLTPKSNVAYSLGTSSRRWKDLWLSGTTMYLGNLIIKESATNTISFLQSDGTTLAAITGDVSDPRGIQSTPIGNATPSTGNFTTLTSVTSFNTSGTATVNALVSNGAIQGTTVSGSANATVNALTVNNSATIGTTLSATGGIQNTVIGNVTPSTGAFTSVSVTGNITTTGNAVSNIGSLANQFNTIFAKATSAQYADLAENYLGTALYPAGTVVEFGGEAEIQVCDTDMSTRIAGVVSTNPAFIMNDRWPGSGPVNPIALQGRVPCFVKGKVRKGDMMVSAGNGFARAEPKPVLGSVIGKALENFDGTEGVIEVVVGRL